MKSSNVRKVRKDLSLPPGLWQLFRYGRLTQLPTLKVAIWIEAYFREVELDERGGISRWTSRIETREIPVGEMVAWDVGCVFNATTHKVGQPQPFSKKVERFTVDVSFTDGNCSIVRNGDGIELQLPSTPNDPQAALYFVKVKRCSEAPLIIPCTTVLKTFWGRSSNLIHMLLDSRFLDFRRYVVNPERSMIDRDNRAAFIWLRQWSLDDDAKFLATIAFDELAISRARNISLSLHAEMDSSNEKNQRYIVALPPHQQHMTLTVLALPQKTETGTCLFVQRVMSSTYKPEFDILVFDRDNDGRKVTQDHDAAYEMADPDIAKKPINRPKRRAPRNEGESEFELAQDHPNLSTTTGTTNVGQFDPVFGGISSVVAEKLEQLTQEYKNEEQLEFLKFQRWSRLLSTLPGTSQSSIAAIGTTLSSGDVLNDPTDTSTALAGYPLITLLEQLIRESESDYNEVTPKGVLRLDVKPIFPWRPALAYDERWMFPLPAEHDDYEWAWLYSDPDQRERKRAICLQITFWGVGNHPLGIGYLVDVEGRFTKPRTGEGSKNSDNSPMLFIWPPQPDVSGSTHTDTKLLEKQLRQLVLELVSEGGGSAQTLAQQLGLEAEPRKHKRDGVMLSVLLDELFRLVTAKTALTIN